MSYSFFIAFDPRPARAYMRLSQARARSRMLGRIGARIFRPFRNDGTGWQPRRASRPALGW
jgi:hypothetical protein